MEKALGELVRAPSPQAIQAYREQLEQLPQSEPPVAHYFADGLYARPMHLLAGESVVGARHRYEHLCIVVGECLVYDGKEPPKHLEGLQIVVSKPGAQRVIVALAETIWINVHATQLKDVAQIERELIEPDGTENRFFHADGTPQERGN